ncbi:MAG TPA: PKD domain-containing protein, partial [Nocardioides sp.]|nr:PKD domain-containing protein [Nocardioides sp.]
FPRNNSDPALAPPLSSECNATIGFDGPSGVGAPTGVALFAATNPSLKVRHPAGHAHKSLRLRLKVHPRLGGTKVAAVTVRWGDGHSSKGKSLHPRHTYQKAGRYHVTVVVTDDLGQATQVSVKVEVKKAHRH